MESNDDNKSAQFVATPTVPEPIVGSQLPAQKNYPTENVQIQGQTSNTGTILLIILLVLTFFTGLGSALFMPIMIVSMYAVYRYVVKGQKVNGQPVDTGLQANPIFRFVKFLFIAGMVFVSCILGFIALVFIGLATGIIKLNFGC